MANMSNAMTISEYMRYMRKAEAVTVAMIPPRNMAFSIAFTTVKSVHKYQVTLETRKYVSSWWLSRHRHPSEEILH